MWRRMLHDARAGHRGLVLCAAACVPCACVVAVLGLVDDRVITGAPAWNKPLKFFVSAAIYAVTVAWYLGQWRDAPGEAPRPRLLAWMGTLVWVALTFELALIAMQAWRGVGSHFNIGSPVDALVFNVMGLMILALSVGHAWLCVALLRARWSDRARLSACRWGAGITLAGLLVGATMLVPSAAQISDAQAGRMASVGAHTVGAPDGGPGLPFVNWSTAAGDRRVAHFVGLHAMQALPALVLSIPAGWQAGALRHAARATGVAYALLTALLFLQARQARPLLHPGTAIGFGLAVIALGWVGAMLVVQSRSSQRRHPTP